MKNGLYKRPKAQPPERAGPAHVVPGVCLSAKPKLLLPTGPGFGEHAVVGNLRIQIKAQQPKEVRLDSDLFHQFALAGDVVEQEQQQRLDDDPRIQREVTRATLVVKDSENNKGKVQGGGELAQQVVGADPGLPIDLVGKRAGWQRLGWVPILYGGG